MLARSSLLLASAAAVVSDDEWAAWKQEQGRVYNSNDEDAYRRRVFEENMIDAAEQQRRNPEAEFGATQFSDLTYDEFKSAWAKPSPSEPIELDWPLYVPDPSAPVNATIDWQEKGAVLAVQNQGSFGTCWSFAVRGTMEGAMFTTGKKPVDLANQMLIDCCSTCSGHPDHSFDWIRDNGGMDTLASYGPYEGNPGTCKHSQATVGQEIESWAIVKPESAFMAALNDGPFHVAIDCGSLRSYKKGVLTNAQCESPGDHDVLLVGAGEADGQQYWRIKNSWGTSFGEAGYFRVRRDHKEMCLGEPNSFGSPASVVVGKKVVV